MFRALPIGVHIGNLRKKLEADLAHSHYLETVRGVGYRFREENKVVFRIANTGVSLTPEQCVHIFERFYRVDTSRSRAFGGSGIGLTIAQSLAQAMGREIGVASVGPGQGSRFTLTLPQASVS